MPETRANGAAIRVIREAKGIKQAALAARLGITAAYLSTIESGTKLPPLDTISRIATELGCKIDAISYPAPAVPAET